MTVDEKTVSLSNKKEAPDFRKQMQILHHLSEYGKIKLWQISRGLISARLVLTDSMKMEEILENLIVRNFLYNFISLGA